MEEEDEVDIVGEFQDVLMPESSVYDGLGLNLSELLPELGSSSWLLGCNQNWSLDGDIEVRSNLQPEVSPQKETFPKINEQPLENVKPQKHRKYWSDIEKEIFLEGFKRYGNKWSKISKLLGTRTTLQVKSFARQFLKQGSSTNKELKTEEDNQEVCDPKLLENVVTSHNEESGCLEIPIDTAMLENDTISMGKEEIVRIHRENSRTDNDNEEDVDIEGLAEISDNENRTFDLQRKKIDNFNSEHHKEVTSVAIEVSSDENEETRHINEESKELIIAEGLKTMRFDVPEKEIILKRDSVNSNEKMFHYEFFQGRPQKTPERYLKIRNYILDSWEKCKPSYLNKTSVRPGLKNCGDVNCIGRIHTYLEQIGAINFGCEQTVYVNEYFLVDGSKILPSSNTNKKATAVKINQLCERSETMRPRKRKVPDLTSGSQVHDYTIEHGDNGEIVDVAAVFKQQKRKKSSTNPFHLIPCSEFSSMQPAPFEVQVDVKATFVMDIHAHMSSLEVIGLLGGHYDFSTSILHILCAEPCRSTSTGLECEMDPVSQTIASERLHESGCSVVGWYHSHPTFAPNPSVRDLDTQTKFQHWFSKGGVPFLGVIVSPHLLSSPFSKFRYVMTDTDSVIDGCHQPFKFCPTFVWNNETSIIEENIIPLTKRLLETSNDFKISMSSIKKIISGAHQILTSSGIDIEYRTAILTNLGKSLIELSTCESQSDSLYQRETVDFSENTH